jgi:BlaI family penicillinase repressor
MAKAPINRLSDAEWSVMQVLWEDAPATARQLQDRLADETGWAYTTVRTLLQRLVDKGVVHTRKEANTSWYEPRLSREQAQRSAVSSLLEKAFDGTVGSLFQHLLREQRLGRRDRDRLAELLAEHDAAGETRQDGAYGQTGRKEAGSKEARSKKDETGKGRRRGGTR